ncbi:U3 small nucleolar RNA-associated protein 11 [Xylaria scruposa]|nr:U3 small nucleolar RNA-associated protein 11 [Xylaria scruposa]
MSSLRNAVNRRVHRERDQLQDRKNRYGLLEKHKDYRLRAQDHNRKKAQLKSLRKKAEDRNEDEFYFGMLSRKGPATALSSGSKKWDGTVAGDRGNKALDINVVRLLKTQDMGYIRSVRNIAMKEVRTLEERVIALGGDIDNLLNEEDEEEDDMDMDFDFGDELSGKKKPAQKNKKIIFADGEDERESRIQQDTEKDVPEDDDDEGPEGDNPEKLRAEQKQRLLEKLQRRLLNARKKQRVLAQAEQELEIQRARMAKTATVGGVTKSGKKFKVRERKR